MPADEAIRGTDADASRARTGPRHAAPRKPLFTRIHVPAGKAIALAAMPTAVLMGMGFTPTLARADDHHPSSKTMTADEYEKCVEAVGGSSDAPSSSSPSASASASKSADTAEPSASASADRTTDRTTDKTSSSGSGSGSGSDDKATPTRSASSASTSDESSSSDTSTPTPSVSASSGHVLGDIGNTVKGVLTGGSGSSASAGAAPSPSASASATKKTKKSSNTSSTATDTTKKVTDTVRDTVSDTVKDTTDKATTAASDATEAASDTAKPTASAAASATASPTASPSASPSASPTPSADCVAATDDTGGVENIVALPDSPWHLEASSLLLKGADYQGIVKVRTADGTVKKVLKYVISGGTDIGDLHQLVDGQKGETYHVQAAKGSMSTIRDGDTVMYTESISGNLFGVIPVTFSPDHPPPLNIPLIYFTNAKVTQAGQFGGTLTVPGMHQYVTGWN